MTEQTAFIIQLAIEHLCEGVVLVEESFEDFIGVSSEPVAALEFSLRKESLLKLLLAILVKEGAFDRIAEHFVGLGYLTEVVEAGVFVLLGELVVPT